jgi:uncharacterized membrane protein (DUF106 family)
LALLLVIFTLQNSVVIDLKLLFWELSDVPLVLTLVVCVITGFIIAALLNYPRIWSLKSKVKALQKELNELKSNQNETEENHPEGIEMKGGSDNDLFNV